jgi:hypothetical protein
VHSLLFYTRTSLLHHGVVSTFPGAVTVEGPSTPGVENTTDIDDLWVCESRSLHHDSWGCRFIPPFEMASNIVDNIYSATPSGVSCREW